MANLNIIENFKETSVKSSRSVRTGLIQPRVSGLAIPRKINDIEFSGYGDIIVKTPLVQLTMEDLDTIIEPGIDYWADETNGCVHKPTGVEGFGLKVIKITEESVRQDLVEDNNKKKWSRIKDSEGWTEWEYAFTSAIPQEIPAVVDTAVKLQTPRTIEITGIMSAKAIFDGTQDIILEITEVAGIGGDSGVLEVSGNTINFSNLDESRSVYFGRPLVEGAIVPTTYYFGENGSANIHTSDVYIGGVSVHDLFADINHNHDEMYSKLDHIHDDLYSKLDHNHDGVYSLTDHLHDDVYSALAHDHDAIYSKFDHSHTITEIGGIYSAGLSKEVDDSLIPKQ